MAGSGSIKPTAQPPAGKPAQDYPESHFVRLPLQDNRGKTDSPRH